MTGEQVGKTPRRMALFKVETENRTILFILIYLKQYHKSSVLVLSHYSDGNNSDSIVI